MDNSKDWIYAKNGQVLKADISAVKKIEGYPENYEFILKNGEHIILQPYDDIEHSTIDFQLP